MASVKTYKGLITHLGENEFFAFGANSEGRHGKGAAKYALDNFGAIYGQAFGHQGKSFGIITKDLRKKIHPSISKERIISQIEHLYNIANKYKNHTYYIAYNTQPNLNGYTPQEMADMFSAYPIPENIVFEEEFAKLLTMK